MGSINPSVQGLTIAPPTASTTSTSSSNATNSGSTNDFPLLSHSTKTSSLVAGSRASSVTSSWRRRKHSFHVTSFALSLACKLLTVHSPPPPLVLNPPSATLPSSAMPSSAPSVLSLVDFTSKIKPFKVYGDILGPQLCKVVLIVKELDLPYVLKVFDHSTVDKDPYAPTALVRAVPALDDPNTGITLWESGAIVEYLIENYDKENKLRYTSFPEIWHQKQWAWHQFGGHEALLGRRAFISIHDYYDALIRGNLATIESHLGSTGNLYLIGDRITYADLMYIAAKEASRSTLRDSFSEGFEYEWRKLWPRSYDWQQRLLQRHSVREFFRERAKIIDERGWAD